MLRFYLAGASTVLFAVFLVLPIRAAEKSETIRPFNGKNLEGWAFKNSKKRNKWTVGTAKLDPNNNRALAVSTAGKVPELVNSSGRGVDAYTLAKFGDCTISLELMVPKDSNSGVYVMGEYEVQVFDSYGREKVGASDIGGLYGAAAPKTNAAKAPGQWQSLVIEFLAPRFEGSKKTANSLFKKVTLNGTVIHEDVEMKGPTPSGVTGRESATGPLMFQGDHGPVAYRNIAITVPGK